MVIAFFLVVVAVMRWLVGVASVVGLWLVQLVCG